MDVASVDRFLLEQVKIPEWWIQEAKALRARYDRMHQLELKHLLNCRDWDRAYDLLIMHLASPWILKGRTVELEHVVGVLKDQADRGKMHSWGPQGESLKQYLRLTRIAKDAMVRFSTDGSTQGVVEARVALEGYLTSNQDNSDNLVDRVALAERMSDVAKLIDRCKAIEARIQSNGLVRTPILHLPDNMRNNQRLQQLQQMTSNILKTVCE